MKTKHLLPIIGAAVCLCCAQSCTKDYAGRAVHFQCRTVPGAGTRTSYSGERYNEGEIMYERIDWSENDQIMVKMQYGENTPVGKTYRIEGYSENGRISNATLAAEGDGFLWQDGSGDHYFWGSYPDSGDGVSVGNDRTVSGFIPASQTQTYDAKRNDIVYFKPFMKTAMMVAGIKTNPGSSVLLDFYPAVTTFDFTVGVFGSTIIKSFTLETETLDGTDLTGSYTATLDFSPSGRPFTVSKSGTGGKRIDVQFGDSGVALDEKTKLNFKVFALAASDITGVRITFTMGDGTTQSLDLLYKPEGSDELTPITFPAFVKANIAGLFIPDAKIKITFEGPLEEKWVDHETVVEIGVDQ